MARMFIKNKTIKIRKICVWISQCYRPCQANWGWRGASSCGVSLNKGVGTF